MTEPRKVLRPHGERQNEANYIIRVDIEDNPTFWIGPEPYRLNFTRNPARACAYLLGDAQFEAARYSYGLAKLGWEYDLFLEPAPVVQRAPGDPRRKRAKPWGQRMKPTRRLTLWMRNGG